MPLVPTSSETRNTRGTGSFTRKKTFVLLTILQTHPALALGNVERDTLRLWEKNNNNQPTLPSQIPIKKVSRATEFTLHAAFLFCLLYKAQLEQGVSKEIVLFVPTLLSAVSLCPPSWPGKDFWGFFFATNEL